MAKLERWIHTHAVAYWVSILVICAVGCFLLLSFTLSLGDLNDSFLFRPTLGITPALSLFFGWPAIIGFTIANGLAFLAAGSSAEVIWFFVIDNAIYLIIAYLLWYLCFAKSPSPYPRLESASKLALCLGLFIVIAAFNAISCVIFNESLALTPYGSGATFILFFDNDFLFSMFLGIPLLIALERSHFIPLPPPWIHASYEHRDQMSLTQKNILLLVAGCVFVVGAFMVIMFIPEWLEAVDNPEIVDYDYLIVEINATLFMLTLLLIIGFILGIIALRYIETHFAVPVVRAAKANKEFVSQVIAYQESSGTNQLALDDIDLSGVKLSGEIKDLVESSNQMRQDMVNYVSELEDATSKAERISTELEIAHSIQLGAVPHEFSSFREGFNLDIATLLRPAREVGGDFYDVLKIDTNKVGIIIADVSGKGMPAALFMMRSLAVIREQMLSRVDVGEALTRANKALCEHNSENLFVTVFIAVIDCETGTLSYANAGHNPSLVMGALDVISYETQTMAMLPGDGLFFYTDGVTEAINTQQELFGQDRLEDVMRKVNENKPADRPLSAQEVVDATIEAVDAFAGEEPQFDDITMMSVIWNPIDRS